MTTLDHPAGGKSPESGAPSNSSNRHNNKKRKHRDEAASPAPGMGSTLSLLRQPDLPAFTLTSAKPQSSENESPKDANAEGWQTIENGRPTKKAKKIPKAHSSNYPAITFSTESRLQSKIKLGDLQGLVLYLLADGTSPQWVSVRHRSQIRKVVVMMVPGLVQSMFKQGLQVLDEAKTENFKHPEQMSYKNGSPDEYYPMKLSADTLPQPLKPFADMFEHLWPVKTPGDDRFNKMHSPLHAMLTAPPQKSQEEKDSHKKGTKPAREPSGWKSQRTPITEYIAMPEDLLENDYTLHPASYDDPKDRADLLESRRQAKTTKDDGWVDTRVEKFEDGVVPDAEIEQGSLTAGREVFAMDCEMCKTGESEFSLTRISLMRWDGTVLLDELVKPERPIIDYLTM
jgi:RNA exonuclease 1